MSQDSQFSSYIKLSAYISHLQTLPLADAQQQVKELFERGSLLETVGACSFEIIHREDLGPTLLEFFARYGKVKVQEILLEPRNLDQEDEDYFDFSILLAQIDEQHRLTTFSQQNAVWEMVRWQPVQDEDDTGEDVEDDTEGCVDRGYVATDQFPSLYHWILKVWKAAQLEQDLMSAAQHPL